jgi:glycosyltransferase involved in cell wall biosynthesis
MKNYKSPQKILLSAYACEPHKGSEPGVGWHWAVELSNLGFEVWVITRANNQPNIDAEIAINPRPNLYFIYYDLPDWAKWWKKAGRGIHLYYLLWQWGAYKVARKLIHQVKFDWVHHVTFVNVRQPSFMGLLRIPFIFGPVAGGERAPWNLRKSYSVKGWLCDLLRDVLNVLVAFDPLMFVTFANAEKIFVTSDQTLAIIPKKYRSKAEVQLAIGIETCESENISLPHQVNPEIPRILFVGQLLYLKGLHLGLRAFAKVHENIPNAQLTLIGSGSDKGWLDRESDRLCIGSNIKWMPWIPRNELMGIYKQYDIFLFPSLHDSGGMAVLEALSNGLPVVCFDLGGPGVIVNDTCGRVIKTKGKNEAQVIQELAEALIDLAVDRDLRKKCSEGSRNRALDFQWRHIVMGVYSSLVLNKEQIANHL